MSQTRLLDPDVDRAIRNRSQHANTLHRIDPHGEDPRPACKEAVDRPEADWTEVSVAAYRPHYDWCRNPGCFGRCWR